VAQEALLEICNDALMAADKGMMTLVVLLDYYAAFDTVDHSVMLELLNQKFGVRGNALKWHQSYLHGRTCSVVADGLTSQCRP